MYWPKKEAGLEGSTQQRVVAWDAVDHFSLRRECGQRGQKGAAGTPLLRRRAETAALVIDARRSLSRRCGRRSSAGAVGRVVLSADRHRRRRLEGDGGQGV